MGWEYRAKLAIQSCGPVHHLMETDPRFRTDGRSLTWDYVATTEPYKLWYMLRKKGTPVNTWALRAFIRFGINVEVKAPSLMVPRGSYVFGVGNEAILVARRFAEPSRFECAIYDTGSLNSFDPRFLGVDVANYSKPAVACKDPVVEFMVPSGLDAGKHSFDFPEELYSVPELFFIDSRRPPPECKVRRNTFISLLRLLPQSNVIEVYPQDWYHEGNYDEDYVAPSHIVRETTSGKLVGAGWRLKCFVLDSSYRKIERWLNFSWWDR